jgi:sortase A
MPDDNDIRTRRRSGIALLWSERFFLIAGIAMLGWCALLLADAGVSQWEARRSLETVSLAASIGPPQVAGGAPSPHLSTPILRTGSAIGDLSIPKVALSAVVLHGSDARTLRRGPGHLENTALPGRAGNAVIAGHRDSFFRGLGDIATGDDIFIDTVDGHLHYRVTSTSVVGAHDMSVLEQTDDATLTLITCYPFWVLGPAPDRYVVRAVLVANASFAALTVPPLTSHEPDEALTASTIDVREAAAESQPIAHDDTTLVRQAIERFRVTYNGRLARHNDIRPGGPLQLHSCDVAVADSQAVATCSTGSPLQPVDGEPGVWTIILERAGQDWAIKSVVSDS